MTIVLAFDIAYTSGWAWTQGPSVVWGHFGIEPDSDDKSIGRCLYNFRRELYSLVDKHKPGCLAWEMPLPGSKHLASFDDYVRGAVGILRLAAFELDLAVLPCDMKSVRKHFIGGNPADAKQQVWHRCKVLGYDCKTDDESDAIAVWDFATGKLKVRELAGRDIYGQNARHGRQGGRQRPETRRL